MREYMGQAAVHRHGRRDHRHRRSRVGDLRKLGAAIVDPAAGDGLFQGCIRKYNRGCKTSCSTRQFPKLFPVTARANRREITSPNYSTMSFDPRAGSAELTFRDLGAVPRPSAKTAS